MPTAVPRTITASQWATATMRRGQASVDADPRRLRAKYPGAQCEVGLLQIGCTIAVHTGPYALGMGVMRRWKKQG